MKKLCLPTKKDLTIRQIVMRLPFYFAGNVCYYGIKYVENKLSNLSKLKIKSLLSLRGGHKPEKPGGE